VATPADAEPTMPQHTIEPTSTSMVWTMVGTGVVLLVAILVFILQNGQGVRVRSNRRHRHRIQRAPRPGHFPFVRADRGRQPCSCRAPAATVTC
jgi:hypothetical protein